MNNSQTLAYREALDKNPVSKRTWWALAIILIVLITDGYDAQAISYMVPILSEQWSLPAATFAPVFTANILGLTLGAMLISPLGDRFGSRNVLMACVLTYSLLTIGMIFTYDITSLMIVRFLCGLGMGAAMPNALALMSDYSPTRYRTLMVTVAAAGYSLGGMLSGLVSAALVDSFGWKVVLMIGGIIPIVMLPFIYRFLPEAVNNLLSDAAPYTRFRAMTKDFMPGWNVPESFNHLPKDLAVASGESRFPVLNLFRNGWARPTIFIWGTYMSMMMLTYFYLSWLPVLLKQSGLSINVANVMTSLFLLSGVIGALLISYVADKVQNKSPILFTMFVGAAIATLFIGFQNTNPTLLVVGVLAAGFCIIGGNLIMNSFTSSFYPDYARATGIGWGLGIGRFGSIMAPVLGGYLLASNTDVSNIFFIFIVPAAIASFFILFVRKPKGYQAPKEESASAVFHH
ncbi:MFS transporter [Acinetobacter sp. ANC 3813]|uniref:MFS transporter n=1 Tax=Acinetobacter sp. ANC 3813 TaxID=1977873 RepID=UPI000A359431|nr:MFS transporter [Acinetobacter sp. ANC 3813]OTG91925.1 MFS transporter [Acinetobacter sp. ANC 3813]